MLEAYRAGFARSFEPFRGMIRTGRRMQEGKMRPGTRAHRRFALPFCAALAVLSALVPSAQASFHEILIREVKAGGGANDSYVVLQAYKAGQQFVGGHSLTAYGAGGGTLGTFDFTSGVSNGQSQMTILVADTAYASSFPAGPAPDRTAEDFDLDPAGGAVCWEEIDCVSWGSFGGGSLPSPAGTPASSGGIPAGSALRRTIAPGCATLLEASDDRDDSAADFFAEAPAPRSNSVVPTEQGCGSAGGGGSGTTGAPGRRGAPQTTLRRKPPKRSRDRTPTFRFRADEAYPRFECRIDKKPFRACGSPYTAKPLRPCTHVFKVRARDDSGTVDPSPAVYAFKVLPRR
jgi:hypothetical protein